MLKRFLKEEEGQTVVEYALLVALIALVVIAVLVILGRRTSEVLDTASGAMNVPAEATPAPVE